MNCPCPKHPFGCYGHPNLCGCEKAKVEAATALEAQAKELEALRGIICKSAEAIGNGAALSPECSVEFMSQLPAEIAAHTDKLKRMLKCSRDEGGEALARAETTERALTSEQNNVYRSFDKWSATLGWGLSGHQPECWALMDSAVDEFVTTRRDLDKARAALKLSQTALTLAAARFNLMGGVGLVNGADPRVGYRDAMAAATAARAVTGED